jgi:hypothetical protein
VGRNPLLLVQSLDSLPFFIDATYCSREDRPMARAPARKATLTHDLEQ